ncbi:hypothetical protein QC762_0058680 [Podospora pseudocomata]|uniref:Uncharacterized protein n=1 Tax=Podospora pseudocomata TaxID=2093779 RepID=A0ABR0GKW4_9PEZI|nr:hypothetical protein QC762_0058680 [Podospora pseudocomata]
MASLVCTEFNRLPEAAHACALSVSMAGMASFALVTRQGSERPLEVNKTELPRIQEEELRRCPVSHKLWVPQMPKIRSP